MKRRHEMAIAELFVGAVADHPELLLGAPRHGGSGEPDVVCATRSGEHGLEIADGYMSPDNATQLWGIARQAARAGEARKLVNAVALPRASAEGVRADVALHAGTHRRPCSPEADCGDGQRDPYIKQYLDESP